MKTNKKYMYETRMEVRDYECDIEGIVNNANYLHYTEHTRHRFLRSLGLSFAALQLKFRVPLKCDDEFVSRLNLHKEGVRYVFEHDIYRASDEQLCFHADVELVTLINGRRGVSEDYDRAFLPVIEQFQAEK